MYPFEKTGVRITTLLEVSRAFEDIGLPDIPSQDLKSKRNSPIYTTCASAMYVSLSQLSENVDQYFTKKKC